VSAAVAVVSAAVVSTAAGSVVVAVVSAPSVDSAGLVPQKERDRIPTIARAKRNLFFIDFAFKISFHTEKAGR
jgi:H+/gluconate symporter-like permease